jgi:mono/diheme cytochrome c family protein
MKGHVCLLMLAAGCAAHRKSATVAPAAPGLVQFRNYCAACHQYDGQGVGDAPPLAGAWVTGPEGRLIKIVLHGVRGPVEVSGKIYDREMPGFGPVLSDQQVASLLSYVRHQFGGAAGPISPETVRQVRDANSGRTEYWRVEELLRAP